MWCCIGAVKDMRSYGLLLVQRNFRLEHGSSVALSIFCHFCTSIRFLVPVIFVSLV